MEDKQTLINNQIRNFFSLQEERCLTYTVFNEAHKIYIASTDEKAFMKFSEIVEGITMDFKRISLGIIEIEKILKDEYQEKILAQLIRDIQNYEQTKLTLTAQLQIKMKEQKDSPSDEVDDDILSINQSLKETIESINETIETLKYEIED